MDDNTRRPNILLSRLNNRNTTITDLEAGLTDEQYEEYYYAVQAFVPSYKNIFGQRTIADFKLTSLLDIKRHGSLANAALHREKERARKERNVETRARKRAEYEAWMNEPGYVYIYRFQFDGTWLYKFRIEPARTKRLELFRCIWVDSGARAFAVSFHKKPRMAQPVKSSYTLSRRFLDEIVNMPNGDPPPGAGLLEVDYPTVAPERKPSATSGMRNTAGYVYLVNEVNGDHYKIGRTRNPENRLQTFNVKLPFRVEYAHLIETDDMYTLEAQLHGRYNHCRVDGEWFALTPSEVDEIKSL